MICLRCVHRQREQSAYLSLVNALTNPSAITLPRIWAAINFGAHAGAIPAAESVKIRPIVTAGFANDVELVKK